MPADENISKNVMFCAEELSVDRMPNKSSVDSVLVMTEEESGQPSEAQYRTLTQDKTAGSDQWPPSPCQLLPAPPAHTHLSINTSIPVPPIPPSPSCHSAADTASPPNWTDSHEEFRILLIFANPTNTHPLRLQTEEKAIREALKGHPRIHIEVLLACTVDDLARHLMGENMGEKGGYQVIHFSGHADRSASLFRHTMRALHTSHDADLASLKSQAVARQVEAAVEALATSFEASLLSSAPSPATTAHSSGNGVDFGGNSQRRHYSSVHPTLPVTSHHKNPHSMSTENKSSDSNDSEKSNSDASALQLSPSRTVKPQPASHAPQPSPHSFFVTSTHHRNRIEKDIHHPHHHGTRVHPHTHMHKDEAASSSNEGGRRVFTPASAASHLLVKEVEVEGPERAGGRGRHLLPFGSVHVPHEGGAEGGVHHSEGVGSTGLNGQLEHELHIPKLVVQSRSSPSDTIEIEYRQRYSYQDIMDIGVGSLAFESETHDTSSGISFVSPPALAALIAQHCGSSLQCVLLNVCGGHIQGDLLSSIVPYTVCFTGKVADKESLAFSRGFYDAIAMGQSVLTAFRTGSGRMDLHKLAPGVPDRLSSLPPLLTLLKNQRLLEVSLRAASHSRQQQSLLLGADSNVRAREAELEAQNQKYLQENKELRSLVAYGMELMKGKEAELKSLRQALEYVSRAAGLANNDKKKIGNGNKRPINVKNISTSNNSSINAHAIKANSPPAKKTGGRKYVNVKSSGYGLRNVKSTKEEGGSSSSIKTNFIKRNKATIILKGKKAKDALVAGDQDEVPVAKPVAPVAAVSKKQRGYMAATQTSTALSSHIGQAEKEKEKEKSAHFSFSLKKQSQKHDVSRIPGQKQSVQKQPLALEGAESTDSATFTTSADMRKAELNHKTPYAPSPALPGPVSPAPPTPLAINSCILRADEGSRQSKSASSSRNRTGGSRLSQTMPLPSSNRAKLHFSDDNNHNVQKVFPTTIASVKPKAWVKYYISDSPGEYSTQDSTSEEKEREKPKKSRGSRSVLGGDEQSREGTSPPPVATRKAKHYSEKKRRSLSGDTGSAGQVSSSASSSASSSQGWRKFLEERRSSSSSSRKPSSSFASTVPRFDTSSSASGNGSSSSPDRKEWHWT